MRGRFGIIIIGLILLAIYYVSNQETNPFTGKKEFNTISIEKASQLGRQSYVQMLQKEGGNVICSQNARSCDAAGREVVEKVREIGDRLRVAAIEYERELVDAGYDFQPVARLRATERLLPAWRLCCRVYRHPRRNGQC